MRQAIDYKDDVRVRTKTEDSWNNFVDWIRGTTKVTTTGHEAKSVTLTRLVFENQDGTADLNAIMNPVDVSAVVTTVPTTHTTVTFTLGDETLTRNFWIILGVIAAIAATIGIIYVVIRIKRVRAIAGVAKPSSQKVSNKSYSKNNKPKRRKK